MKVSRSIVKGEQLKFQRTIATLGLATIIASGCAQDPAFTEKASNITTDELRTRGSYSEGDKNSAKTGTQDAIASRDGSPDSTGVSANASGSGNSSTVIIIGVPKEGGSSPGTASGSTDPSGVAENPVGRPRTGSEPSFPPSTQPGMQNPPPQSSPISPIVVAPPAPVVVTTPVPIPTVKGPHAGSVVVVDFKQETKPKVDILWVIDTSGSMSWAQNKLAGQFESFAKKLQEANVDFQVGVTNLDVCQVDMKTGTPIKSPECPEVSKISAGRLVNGKMVGPLRGEFVTNKVTGTKIMTNSSNFIEAFKDAALLGVSGSGMEHGLGAARMAVQKAQAGVNAGFLRSDAMLSVIMLSDEEDDGVQMWCEDGTGATSLTADGKKDLNACKKGGTSPFLDAFGDAPFALVNDAQGKPLTQYKFTAQNFVDYMGQEKGAGKFRVSAITGMKDANGNIFCPANQTGGPAEAGTNYIKAAQLTGGMVENICNTDWSAGLANLGENTTQLAGKIALPTGKIPFPGTLEVTVNGVSVASSQFTYETAGNFLVLKTPLKYNDQVKITFKETVL